MKLNIQLFAVTKSTTFAESAISIENNTSTLKITIKFSPNNDVTYFSSKTLKCTCNGTQQTASVSLSKGSYVSKTFTFSNISHSSDGTKSVSWSWSCATGTSVLGTISSSGTRTLQTIPRASEIYFFSHGATPEYPTIVWTPNSNEFKFKVGFYYGDNTLYRESGLISPNQTTEYTYSGLQIGNDFFNLVLNSASTTLILKLTTYKSDGTTIIGTDTFPTTTENLSSSIKPTISSINNIVETDSTMIGLNWGVFVKGKSKISYDLKYSFPSPVPGSATIATDTNGQTLSANATISTNTQTKTFTTNVLNTVGNNNISSTIIDSRTRTTSYTSSNAYSVVDYSDPTITTAEVKRVNASDVEDDEGQYVSYKFVGEISSVSNHNDKLFRIGYRVKGSNTSFTYKTISSSYTVNVTSYTRITDWTLSSSNAYEIVFEAIDSFRTASNPVKQTRYIETGKPLMNFNASGKAMAIGKVSEAGANDEWLEVALDLKTAKFNGYVWDYNTADTANTWVLVSTSNGWRHRAIPTAYNNAPSTLSVGSATTASKLGSSNVGNSNKPIYLSGGTPTACTNEIPSVTNETSVVSRTSGATLSSSVYYKYGKVVQLRMVITSSGTTNAGSDCFAGTLNKSSLYPLQNICGIGYSGSSGVIMNVNSSGSITCHVIGANLGSGKTIGFSVTYIVN